MGGPPPVARTPRTGLVLGSVAGFVVVLGLMGGAWYLLFGPQVGASRIAGTRSLGEPGLALSADERRGEALYNANCVSCHGGPTGGSMMDYPPRHNSNGHTWHHSTCELVQVIANGGDEMTLSMREMMAPPDAPKMPAFSGRLANDEINAVLAYIRLMWTPRERSVQEEVTREQCVGS